MKNRRHGIISLALFDLAFVIAIYQIAIYSIWIAAMYLLGIILGFAMVIYSFCTKCSTNKRCSHFFIGSVAQIMPKREIGNYKTTDYLGVLLSVILLLSIPQFWLWNSPFLAIAFWALIIIAGIEINFFVCTRCNNKACAMCKKKEVLGMKSL